MIIVTVAVGSGRSRHVAPKKLHQGGLLEHFLEAVINSIINSVSQLVVTHNYTFLFDLDHMYIVQPKYLLYIFGTHRESFQGIPTCLGY